MHYEKIKQKKYIALILLSCFLLVGFLFFYQREAWWAYLTGNVQEFEYKFKDGLSPVKIGNKWGYRNSEGKMPIKASYDYALPFYDGLGVIGINLDGKNEVWQVGIIDTKGKVVIPLEYYDIIPSGNELLLAAKKEGTVKEKYGFIDRKNQKIIDFNFDFAHSFVDGIASVCVGNKWGFIDTTGNFVIPLQYDEALNFVDGIATVKLNGKWGYIDKTGKVLIAMQYDEAKDFSENGLARVRIGEQWGYIDKNGNFVIKPQFYAAYGFSEGLAKVKMGHRNKGKYGYINAEGKVIIEPQFDTAYDFDGGIAEVKIGGEYAFIDKTGKELPKWQLYFFGNQ